MAGDRLRLAIAIASYPDTEAILSGRIPIAGIEPQFVNVTPQIAAYRRMVREVEFDVCEIAPTTYIIARSFGAPFVALPIFVSRAFHHAGLLVRPDAGIRTPKDLEGKKVGVRAYSVTTGVWTRGILIDDYGLDSSKVTWVVDDEEHVRELKLPSNVISAPAGSSLVEMMAKGEIAAGFSGPAGLGRAGAPSAGWEAKQIDDAAYPELFENARELEAAWFQRTGIYPMHGTIVVKDSVLKSYPWVAQALHEAFFAAKQAWLTELRSGRADAATDRKYRDLIPVVGADPLPFGVEQNRPTIEALERFAFKQQLIARRMAVNDLFVDVQSEQG